jgi:hypothetical protein
MASPLDLLRQCGVRPAPAFALAQVGDHLMSTNQRGRHNNRDQEDRINALKQQAEQAARGEMIAWESDTLSPEQTEQFWRRVVEYEAAASTNHFQQLTEAGLELPDPAAMDDEELTSKLWELIGALAGKRVLISQTNHLSDRELYTLLLRDVLREETPMLPDYPGSAWHVDLVGSGSETDTYLYMKYYADEDWRQRWVAEFPDYDMPAHENPPYDRDRHLPQPDDEPPSEGQAERAM